MSSTLVRVFRSNGARDDELGLGPRQESRREHPDHRVTLLAELNGSAHNICLSAKSPLPQPMREDDNPVLAGLIFVRREGAAQQRSRPKDLQAVGRHLHAADALRLCLAREVQVCIEQKRETGEGRALFFPIQECVGRYGVPFARAGSFPQLHKLPPFQKRKHARPTDGFDAGHGPKSLNQVVVMRGGGRFRHVVKIDRRDNQILRIETGIQRQQVGKAPQTQAGCEEQHGGKSNLR